MTILVDSENVIVRFDPSDTQIAVRRKDIDGTILERIIAAFTQLVIGRKV